MKTNTFLLFFISLLMLLSVQSCKEKNESVEGNINGFVQKGPYISGSSVIVFDLKNDLSQTGMSYIAQIEDNTGSFNLQNVSLNSGLVCLRADGYYYNEVSGKQSESQLTLYALSDIRNQETINVNILTHLEKSRIEYLIKNGDSFDKAKSQAQEEVLGIFGIEKEPLINSEEMNILKGGDDNAILLAISAILQGYRSESELTELLSKISNDIESDGTLDDVDISQSLVNHAFYLDAAKIRSNLESKSDEIGETTYLPPFEEYLSAFLEGKNVEVVPSLVTYPENGSYGKNILYLLNTNYQSGSENVCSLAADIPENVTLKVVIKSLSADTVYLPATDTTSASQMITHDVWYYHVGTNQNWAISNYDETSGSQSFTATDSDILCDLKLYFEKGEYSIYYYEMNSEIPTRRKTIITY